MGTNWLKQCWINPIPKCWNHVSILVENTKWIHVEILTLNQYSFSTLNQCWMMLNQCWINVELYWNIVVFTLIIGWTARISIIQCWINIELMLTNHWNNVYSTLKNVESVLNIHWINVAQGWILVVLTFIICWYLVELWGSPI